MTYSGLSAAEGTVCTVHDQRQSRFEGDRPSRSSQMVYVVRGPINGYETH